MKPSLLEYLACPSCASRLTLDAAAIEADEVIAGTLKCIACQESWQVRAGVPRFTSAGDTRSDARTAHAFGWEWKAFPGIDDHHEQQFLDWIAPADQAMFRGAVVLEGGCGKGRHTRLAARYGAAAIIGVDLSEAADVAHANTRALPNAHIIQADLLRLPIRGGSIDYAFSVGVLHHLPDPAAGFRSLAAAVRPGGALSVWVYGKENNTWIARFVSPLRRAVTSRLPSRVLWLLSMLLAVPLWIVLVTVYRAAARPGMAWLRPWLFYYPYLSYISRFPYREVHHIVHDHLAAPVAHYLTREQVRAWYAQTGCADEPVLAWHNRNSWRGFGRLSSRPEKE